MLSIQRVASTLLPLLKEGGDARAPSSHQLVQQCGNEKFLVRLRDYCCDCLGDHGLTAVLPTAVCSSAKVLMFI